MKRRNEVVVGIFLTLALVLGIAGTIWLVRGGFATGYPLYSVFDWGANLKVGQPVRLAGVQVGYVGDVQLNPDGTLLLVMQVQEEYRVPENARAVVTPVGIFGDAEVSLLAEPSRTYYEPGDTVPPGIPAPGIAELTAKADSVVSVAVNVSRTLETQLVAGGGIEDIRETLAQTAALTARLNRVAAEQSAQLTRTQEQLRQTLAAIDSAEVGAIVNNLQQTTQNLAAVTDSLQQTMDLVNTVLAKVNSGDGTAARLLNDAGLYEDLRRLTTRLDSLTLDFQRNPRRYINLEIF